jgi:hypothetical protein
MHSLATMVRVAILYCRVVGLTTFGPDDNCTSLEEGPKPALLRWSNAETAGLADALSVKRAALTSVVVSVDCQSWL